MSNPLTAPSVIVSAAGVRIPFDVINIPFPLRAAVLVALGWRHVGHDTWLPTCPNHQRRVFS